MILYILYNEPVFYALVSGICLVVAVMLIAEWWHWRN